MDHQKQKELIEKRQTQLTKFNNWELRLTERPDNTVGLAAVFRLYDMMPDRAKQRPVDVSGIIKMRQCLACLT